uniref:Uncharacterized protein n=1 Tax=Arundo donax TaxID=35708 RepID=A0A0A9BBU8_ARUDO
MCEPSFSLDLARSMD